MATVTGLTAARMAAIEAASIVDGEVVGDDLILTRHDSTTVNAGNVRGTSGDAAVVDYTDPVSNAATVQQALDRRGISRIHDRDGVTGFSTLPISKDAGDTLALPHIMSVNNGRLRITSDAGLTYGQRREARVIDATSSWVNSEIRSIWYGPNAMTPGTTQMGHVHRATALGGIIFDQNVFGTYDTTWTAAWSWTGTSLGTISADTASPGSTHCEMTIRSYLRTAATPAYIVIEVDSIKDFAVGDQITVKGTPEATINGEKTIGGVLEGSNGIFGNYGPAIWFTDAVNTTAIAKAASVGAIQHSWASPVSPKIIYPFHAASRVIDDKFYGKKWRVGTEEPPWTMGAGIKTESGAAWGSDLSTASPSVPVSGKCGVLVNHLYSGQYVEYGDIEVRQL